MFITTEIFDCQQFENPEPEFKLYLHNLNVIIKILITKKITIMEKISYRVFNLMSRLVVSRRCLVGPLSGWKQ